MLKISDVARRLNVHRDTVRRWLVSGQMQGLHARHGGMWRIPETELDRFLRDGTAPPPG